jgi:hypothetical protein
MAKLLQPVVEFEAKLLADELLAKIQRENINGQVVATAIADVLATLAAAMDNQIGRRIGMDARMQSLEARAGKTYDRVWKHWHPEEGDGAAEAIIL